MSLKTDTDLPCACALAGIQLVLPAADPGGVPRGISMDKTRFLVKLRAGGCLSGLMANVIKSVVLEFLLLIDVI